VRDKKTLEAFAMKVINVAMLENVRRSPHANPNRTFAASFVECANLKPPTDD
jgi:hypothetical protein